MNSNQALRKPETKLVNLAQYLNLKTANDDDYLILVKHSKQSNPFFKFLKENKKEAVNQESNSNQEKQKNFSPQISFKYSPIQTSCPVPTISNITSKYNLEQKLAFKQSYIIQSAITPRIQYYKSKTCGFYK